MALNTLPPGAFADDAITSDKINLANNFAFTGTVTGAAKIGQIVYGQTGTQVSSSSNSYVDTGITATITPSATSSTIQIFVGIMGLQSAGTTNARMDFQILRAGSGITTSGANMWDQSGNNTHRNGGFAMNFKDSPSSTSSLIYKVQFKAVEGTCEVQRDGNSGFSTITLIEVLA